MGISWMALKEALFGWHNPIPPTPQERLDRKDYLNVLSKKHGIKSLTSEQPIDSYFRLVSKESLDKIARRLVSPADWYLEELWDCDDYALQAQLDAGRKFEVSVRMATGWLNNEEIGINEYHSVVIALDSEFNMWILEPNAGFPWAGEWFTQGEHGMKVDKVFA